MSTVPSYAAAYFGCTYDKPWDPVVLRKLFTSALQVHWENPEHHLNTIGSADLGCLQFSADTAAGVLPSDTLTVAPLFTYDETRPFQGVYVGVGDMQLQKVAIDSYGGHNADNSSHTNTTVGSASITFKHIHSSPDTVTLMASSTQVFLHALREHLKGAPDFLSMDSAVFSTAKQIEKSSERYFEVDLVWQLRFNYRVAISLESHRLKKYAMDLSESN
jgi:hypothetical protein